MPRNPSSPSPSTAGLGSRVGEGLPSPWRAPSTYIRRGRAAPPRTHLAPLNLTLAAAGHHSRRPRVSQAADLGQSPCPSRRPSSLYLVPVNPRSPSLSHSPPYSLRLKEKHCEISPLLPIPCRRAAGITRRVLQPPLPAGTRERKVFVEYRTCDRLRKRCRNAAPEGSSTRS